MFTYEIETAGLAIANFGEELAKGNLETASDDLATLRSILTALELALALAK